MGNVEMALLKWLSGEMVSNLNDDENAVFNLFKKVSLESQSGNYSFKLEDLYGFGFNKSYTLEQIETLLYEHADVLLSSDIYEDKIDLILGSEYLAN